MMMKLSNWSCLENRMAGRSHSMKIDNSSFGRVGAVQIFGNSFNLLAPELFSLILAHPVNKMLIIQEPNKLVL